MKISRNNKEENTQYAVYIHLPINENRRFWERASLTNDPSLACEQAELLYSTQKYPKIEVIKKFFCSKSKKWVSQTLLILEQQKQRANLFKSIFQRLLKH